MFLRQFPLISAGIVNFQAVFGFFGQFEPNYRGVLAQLIFILAKIVYNRVVVIVMWRESVTARCLFMKFIRKSIY